MLPAAIAEGLRAKGIDAIAVQETPAMRGIPDHEVFVAAQLESRCVVTLDVEDFLPIEAAWRAEHDRPHAGLILVSARAAARSRSRLIGRLVARLADMARAGRPAPGMIAWLE